MDATSKREVVGQSPLFEDLPAIHLDALAAYGRIRRVPAQQPIFTQGAPADALYPRISDLAVVLLPIRVVATP